MKRYVFEVVINEGNDEFWESLKNRSGCDEVQEWLKGMIESDGSVNCDGLDANCELRLKSYEDV